MSLMRSNLSKDCLGQEGGRSEKGRSQMNGATGPAQTVRNKQKQINKRAQFRNKQTNKQPPNKQKMKDNQTNKHIVAQPVRNKQTANRPRNK